ncbi:hypothetical protein [Actinoplanes xinjiangensis]|uniref:Secreted protein n=1 Tax=Actinoplanes xinjiangensis TaxID=512350 RepID=A0A316GC90_9ACTN|nr:hypothetical protein [Actinoplanes xinjiangensis]PWK52157.1 hypothetical protein BC793_101166 [Actinoplanes xinjiangensis]GIF37137.1 hypothetical protein Axi01nite_14480 [Actinoplanes xinjiangensis]
MTGSRPARHVSAAALAVIVAALAGCTPGDDEQSTVVGTPATSAATVSPPPATSAEPRPGDDRQTIEYRDVQVDVPADWVRAESRGCEFEFVQWQPAGSPPCRLTTGVVFYGAATFDPAHRPGVQKGKGDTWVGYVYAGDLAVYAAGPDRALVQDVLDTARPPAPR